MKQKVDPPLIISASRTKDMVRRSPELLAKLLLGEAPCRWGPRAPFGFVDPADLHSAVFWTKDPGNILQHDHLRGALRTLRENFGVQISLQITATALGGSFVEPGIPGWRQVYENLEKIFAEKILNPDAVMYRYDPFLQVRTPSGRIFSNMNLAVFRELCAAFTSLGIKRVTASRADAVRYPRVVQRVQSTGMEWVFVEDRAALDFCREMETVSRASGADFSVCCEPHSETLTTKWGCIDARWLNRAKGDVHPPATEILHNQIGRQRPTCRCTYSRDIGYSSGSATCYSGGYGCLYCYSQGNARLPDAEKMAREVQEFDEDPIRYLKRRDLPLELLGNTP